MSFSNYSILSVVYATYKPVMYKGDELVSASSRWVSLSKGDTQQSLLLGREEPNDSGEFQGLH